MHAQDKVRLAENHRYIWYNIEITLKKLAGLLLISSKYTLRIQFIIIKISRAL